jgi:hypothetical protein
MPAAGLIHTGLTAAYAEATEEVLQVPLHGVDPQVKLQGNFAIGPTLVDEQQNGLFALRQGRFRDSCQPGPPVLLPTPV